MPEVEWTSLPETRPLQAETTSEVLDPEHEYTTVLRAVTGAELDAPVKHGEPVDSFPLRDEPVVLGRGGTSDVLLRHALVGPRHAVVEPAPAGWSVRDLGSPTGTFLNGRAVRRTRLRPGDLLQIGPYVFQFKGGVLRWLRRPTALTLAALNLRQSAGPVSLLDDVTLVARPGEFVGLLGPSGAGKTTLLNALSGLRPATGGRVVLNGDPLYEQYGRWRRLIGYVPQDEIVHPELTCRQAFAYAARLRLPADVPADELAAAVNETLETLELTERADVAVARLSGGQRKRVSIGIELLARPRLLFLDEPTSGLDPGTETRLMRLFRALAHEGRTVVCTTHGMENVDLFDKIAVLAEGGRLAFFGPPADARAYFGVERTAELFDRLDDRPPADWQALYRESELGQQLEEQAAAERLPRPFHRQGRPDVRPGRSAPAQWSLLARRFVRTLVADGRTPALLLIQPAVLAGLVCMVFDDLRSVHFLLVVSALWLACSQAAQQLVKERPVYRRERLAGLSLGAYLMSKFVPLAAVGVAQAFVMLGIAWYFRGPGGVRWMQAAGMVLAAWNGVALGLLISALARNADRATAVVPLVLLPQIILGGLLVPLPEMNVPTRVAAELTGAKWASQVMEVAAVEGRPMDETLFGRGSDMWRLWNLYPAYDLRDPAEQARFLREHRDENVRLGGRLAAAIAALATLTLGLLAGVAVILRGQDIL